MAIENEEKESVVNDGAAIPESTNAAGENVGTEESVAAPSNDQTEVANEDVSKGADIVEKPVKTGPTELEKATYSFHKQFARQNKKHAAEIAEFKKIVADLQDRVNNPDKYRPKYRDDFNTADEYIDYRSKQQFEALMAKQREEAELAAKKKSDEDAMYTYYKERASKNLNNLFKTDEEKSQYREAFQIAQETELLDKIDNDERVASYLMRRPYGPAILMELVNNQESQSRLFDDPYMTSDERMDELKDIERDVIKQYEAKKAMAIEQVKQVQEPPKVIGKPGVDTIAKKNIWDDPKSLEAFLDSRR